MSKDSNWRDDLWRRHAQLFVQSQPFGSGIASLPDGWREIVEILLRELASISPADGPERITVTRLRERRGTLETEWSTESPRASIFARAAIERRAARAACTCAMCGEAAERYPVGDDVIARCVIHRPRYVTALHPPWPRLLINRTIEGGVSRITHCRFYDRGHDAWIDVDPADFGIPRSP